MSGFLAVMRKEFLIIAPRPPLWIGLLLFPAILVLLISFAFQNLLGSPARLPLPIVDLDGSPASSLLVSALESTDRLDISYKRGSGPTFGEADALDAFQRGRRPAVLVIPDGYGESFAAGRRVDLVLYTDPAQPSPAFLVRVGIQAVVDQLSLTEAGVWLASKYAGGDDARVRTAISEGVSGFVNAPTIRPDLQLSGKGRGLPSPFEQTVPGFTMWYSAILSSYLLFVMIQERRDWGVGARLAASPAPAWTHVVGKALVAYLLGIVQFVIMMGAANLAFGMELGSIPDLAAVIAVFLLIPIAVGIGIAAFASTIVVADGVFGVWSNVGPLLGGLLVPVFLLPRFLREIAKISPYYWSLQAVQEVTVRNGSLREVWSDLAIIAAFVVALLIVGIPRFSYRQRGRT